MLCAKGLHHRVTIPHFLNSPIWKTITKWNSHSKGEKLSSAFCRRVYLHMLSGIFLWRFVFFIFICLFNNLFIIIWTYGCLFYSLSSNAMLISLLNLLQLWPLRNLSRLAFVTFRYSYTSFLLFGGWKYSLLFGITRYSRFILHLPCLSHFFIVPCFFLSE